MFPSPQTTHHSSQPGCSVNQLFFIAITFVSLLPGAQSGRLPVIPVIKRNGQADFFQHNRVKAPAKRGPPDDGEGRVSLVITNNCDTTIWPGLATQAGTGPGTGGFGLEPGKNRTLWVSPNWQGRVWGRTNCTVNGNSCACTTGDCFSKLDCEFSVSACREE